VQACKAREYCSSFGNWFLWTVCSTGRNGRWVVDEEVRDMREVIVRSDSKRVICVLRKVLRKVL
jgi:hypothetical protein